MHDREGVLHHPKIAAPRRGGWDRVVGLVGAAAVRLWVGGSGGRIEECWNFAAQQNTHAAGGANWQNARGDFRLSLAKLFLGWHAPRNINEPSRCSSSCYATLLVNQAAPFSPASIFPCVLEFSHHHFSNWVRTTWVDSFLLFWSVSGGGCEATFWHCFSLAARTQTHNGVSLIPLSDFRLPLHFSQTLGCRRAFAFYLRECGW